MDIAFVFLPILLVAAQYIIGNRKATEITDERCSSPRGC